MSINSEVQSSILEAIKQKIDPAYSFVDELAEILSISKDSAYRRIRGETLFDIAEVELLTRSFDLSLDRIFKLESNTINFNTDAINPESFRFNDYLKSIQSNLSLIRKFEQKHLFYSARDIFPPHYYQIPELAAFKLFFWLKSYLNLAEYRDLNFDLNNLPNGLEESMEIARKTWHEYMRIPVTEVWTHETANITLRQIEYCRQAGILNLQDAETLCNKFRELIQHISHEAEIGRMYHIHSSALEEGAEYNLFFNETAIGDNSLLFKMGEKKMAFITYASINFLATADDKFCGILESHFKNTMKYSALISQTSDKIRKGYFNKLLAKIKVMENRIVETSDLF